MIRRVGGRGSVFSSHTHSGAALCGETIRPPPRRAYHALAGQGIRIETILASWTLFAVARVCVSQVFRVRSRWTVLAIFRNPSVLVLGRRAGLAFGRKKALVIRRRAPNGIWILTLKVTMKIALFGAIVVPANPDAACSLPALGLTAI